MPQAPEGSPAEEATETPQQETQEQGQGGGKQPDPTKVLTTIQTALAGMAQAFVGSKQIPQEAQKHLQAAMSEYNAFLSIAGKALGVQMPDAGGDQSMGNQDANAAGSKSAMPADQAQMKPGARPMMG